MLNTNLDHYRIFYEVADCGNITKASERLFISQPAVSMAIKALEDELGVKLFLRNKKGVVLTAIGERIFEQVKEALAHFVKIENIAQEENELLQGQIVIGCGTNIAKEILVKPISSFLSRYPNIKIRHTKDVQNNMIDMLYKGKLDLVITHYNDQISNLSFIPLGSQAYTFVKSPSCKEKRFIKLPEGSYVQSIFDDFIVSQKENDTPAMRVSGYNLAIELATSGVGITLAPLNLAEKKIEEGALVKVYQDYPLPVINFGCYYNPEFASYATREFIKFFEKA